MCFVALVAEDGLITEPRVVARGTARAVLAAIKDVPAGSIAVHNHPTGLLEPSEADFRVAHDLFEQGVGFAITNNEADDLYVVVDPPPTKPRVLLDELETDAILAPGGAMEQWHGSFEDRPSQRDMARSIVRAYNEGGVVLAEAGTGTGKSVAYLIPAIQWAIANGERTVVSTNTINLQEQLVRKDLPLLKRVIGDKFRFALVKGRGNYISIRRAKLAMQTQQVLFDDPQQRSLTAVLEWLDTTKEGSLQDMPFTPVPEVWEAVASESDVCLRAKCPHFEQCFYQKARREAAAAEVLVANHHLLFSDLAVRKAQENYTATVVLPPYRRIVLDEAHNIEDAATEHLGASLSRRSLFRTLGRLERRGKGLLPAIESKMRAADSDLIQTEVLRTIADELKPLLERLRAHSAEFFAMLEQLLLNTEDGVLRLTDSFNTHPAWTGGLDIHHHNVSIQLETLMKGITNLREAVLVDRRWTEFLHEQLIELNGVMNRLLGAAEALHTGFAPSDDGVLVRWLERRMSLGGGDANVTIRAAPVDLAEVMRDALFDRVDTAVLTSATLATRDGFGFVRRRLGVGAGLRVREAIHPSPFEYETQATVVVPTDLPVPGAGDNPQFDRAITQVVADLAAITNGGVFALFTSYRSLRSVATELRRRGLHQRWPLFVQGEGTRTKLLDSFVGSGNGVLLGVASFWEGVDVPGDPLRGIVITKLPFKVPTEPLTAARIEAIERNGGNSFAHYVLPHAALRLKQGFGRLIRTRSDRGSVVLMDRRVLEKGYGKYFLDSLPPAPVQTGAWNDLRLELTAFYGASRPLVLA